MSLFTPSRRWQPPFYPFKKRNFSEKIEEAFERTFKGLLWGCRMCGNCLLQETAFICPMACPKGLRNGPCGGSTPEHCCVDETRPCIWYEIFRRADRMGRLEKLLEVFPPLDWDKTGTSALRDVYTKIADHGFIKTANAVVRSSPSQRNEKWDRFFKEIRQPDWWHGDAQPHFAPAHTPVSQFEQALISGKFVLTCEITPPNMCDFSSLDSKFQELVGWVDGVNITDGASAVPRVSPFACALRARDMGVEPVLQMAARDRTRLSFQADLLGASASGIHNILLITGDHPNKGNPPFSKMDIWDFDSIQSIWMARKLRDEGTCLDGRVVKNQPRFLIGAAASPFASLPKYQTIRTEKKMNAGVQYFQTNLIFDLPRFEEYLEALDQRSVLGKVPILAGVAPIKSLRMAQFLRTLPGIVIPDHVIERVSRAKDPAEEGHQICLEMVEKLKSLPGVQGIHFMAITDNTALKRLITESNLHS